MIRRFPLSPIPSTRRGHLLPAIAVGILVAGGCLALVLNRFQLADAQEELRSAASAAALAACQELVGDDTLKAQPDDLALTDKARVVVDRLALKYIRSGEAAPTLAPRFGRVVINPRTGEQTFLETDHSPTSVQVSAHRDRANDNGVAVFAPYLTGDEYADAVAVSEASLTNLILGVRPVGAAGVPALPLGILETSTDPRVPSWTTHITQRQGADKYSWDEGKQELVDKPDGLPEIILQPQSEQMTGNVVLVNVGAGLSEQVLERQFQNGWKADDLEKLGGEFLLDGGPLELGSRESLGASGRGWLESQIGQPRILVLYLPGQKPGGVSATQLVSGRILKVTDVDGQLQVVVQPAVVATRMAVLDEDALWRGGKLGNPYIYKVSLTK